MTADENFTNLVKIAELSVQHAADYAFHQGLQQQLAIVQWLLGELKALRGVGPYDRSRRVEQLELELAYIRQAEEQRAGTADKQV